MLSFWGVQSHGELNMGAANHSPQNEKELLISTRFIPLSHPYSGAGVSSASPNPRDSPEVMHAELYRGNNSQTSAGALHCSSSSNTFVPLLPGNEAPQELSSDSTQQAWTNDDDASKILSSSTNGPMKACSSNQKCMSPPQIQLKDMSLRPSPNLTNEQTIIRQGTPSVRPFSWCRNSKYGIPQVKSHPNDSNGGHFALVRSFLSYLNPLSYLGLPILQILNRNPRMARGDINQTLHFRTTSEPEKQRDSLLTPPQIKAVLPPAEVMKGASNQ